MFSGSLGLPLLGLSRHTSLYQTGKKTFMASPCLTEPSCHAMPRSSVIAVSFLLGQGSIRQQANGKEGSGIPPWRHRSVVHSWDGVCCIFWPFFVHLTDKCCPLFTSWYTMSEHSFYQPKKCSTVKYFITLQEILLHLPFTKNILYLIWQMELAAEHCHVPSSPERRYNLG